MIFTGEQLIRKRNFYTQNNNFEVNINFSVDDPAGRYDFGLTGDNSLFITLESGKILYNNLFLHSYAANKEYNLNLKVTSNNLNLSKDNEELIWGMQKPTGNYDYFFFKRLNTGINAEFDFAISGRNLPIYSIDKVGYYLSSGQHSVTGLFTNVSGFSIKAFDSRIFPAQNLSFSGITGDILNGQSKPFEYSGDFSNFDFSQPVFTLFNTNVGELSVNFQIIDAATLDRFVLLDEVGDFSFNPSNIINRTLTYTNFSGGFGGVDFPTNLFFKLEYISGSGQTTITDFADNARFTANAYGNFLESGTVTGIANIVTGSENVSGVYTIYFNRFQWATGAATGFFSGVGTGMASGINYTGAAYGNYTGLATGLIHDGSGTLVFNSSQLIGASVGQSLSINYNSYINSTGYMNISGLNNNDVIYVGVESAPIIKGLQFQNATGLAYYLNNTLLHKVTASSTADVISLGSRFSGTLGNDIFVRENSCNIGAMDGYSPLLIDGQDIGSTGNAVYAITDFIGDINLTITGSGYYTLPVTSVEHGTFTFTRTFTGSWDLLTGVAGYPLVAIPKQNNIISGGGLFPPNSSMIFQISHQDSNFNQEGALFVISGSDVLNPISTTISQ